MLSILGTFVIAAAIVTPMSLHASNDRDVEPVAAQNELNQQVIEQIANLIGRSAEVLGVHTRGQTPYSEVVLRLHGAADDYLSPDEIAVVSHSEILQTITLYTLLEDAEQDHERGRYFESRILQSNSREVDGDHRLRQRARLAEPRFRNLWRSDPGVTPRILATGVTDMKIDIVERIDSEHVRLRIELTWGGDSSDEADTALVFIDAVLRE